MQSKMFPLQPSRCPLPLPAVRRMSSDAPTEADEDGMAGKLEKQLLPFLDHSLRGMGQVVFCNSAVSGALITGGLCWGDPWLGAMAGVGCMSATAVARIASLDTGATSNGLMGYNGALVGCAFSVFLGAQGGATILATMLGGATSAILVSKLGAVTAPVPQWTLAFNMTALTALVYVRPFADAAAAATPLALSALAPLDWCAAALTGVSQIFVVNNPMAGALVLAGIAWYSPGAAVATLVGSVIGVLTGVAVGADGNDIKAGLWGFNPALTALSVSIFFVPLGGSYFALACGGAVATALTTIGFKTFVGDEFESPSLTLPFCLVATGCFLLGGRVPGLVHARAPHSPEVNLSAFRAVTKS